MPNGKPKPTKRAAPKPMPKPPAAGGNPGVQAELKQLKQQFAALKGARTGASGLRAVPNEAGHSDFKSVLKAVINPADNQPFRFTPESGRPTFATGLKQIEPAGSTSATSSGTVLAENCGFAAIFRDARLASIKYEVKASPDSGYQMQFGTEDGPSVNWGPSAGDYFVPQSILYETGWDRHGKKEPLIIDSEGTVRFWFDVEPTVATTSKVIIGNLPAATAVAVTVSVMLNGVVYEFPVIGAADGSGNFTINAPVGSEGYWAIRLDNDLSTFNPTVKLQTSCPHSWRHRSLPDLIEKAADMDALRVTALSLMYSDRSAALYTQGSITTYQSDGSTDWSQHAGLDLVNPSNAVNNYEVVANYNDSADGAYKKGRYNFVKPNGYHDFEMQDLGDLVNGQRVFPPVDWGSIKDYVVMLFDSGNQSSLYGEWSFHWHVEGETESQWRNTQPPHIHPRVFDDAFFIAAQASQNYENKNHLKEIWNFVKKSAGVLGSIAPIIAPALPPQFAGPVAAAGMGLKGLSQL